VNLLEVELKRCGFRTLMVAPGDADTPLGTRTALANKNKANAYISCHYNAGGGEGVETYSYPGSASGKKLATLVHKYVRTGTKQKDRGVKTANFQVLRETNMPACLVEYGFMDDPNRTEAKRMIDSAFQKECAVETAKGICEYFEVKYVPEATAPPVTPSPFYDCVVNGAEKATFSARNVDEIAAKVKDLLLKKTGKIELNKRT
jgi:N-acetylmuramoyl-L-alanine amidase